MRFRGVSPLQEDADGSDQKLFQVIQKVILTYP